MKGVSFIIHNKTLSTILEFMLIRRLLVGLKIASGECQSNKPYDKRKSWNIQLYPLPQHGGKGEVLKTELTNNGHRFNQSYRCDETSIKTPKNKNSIKTKGFRELPG